MHITGIGREIRVTFNLGDIAIFQMNQYPTTAVAGATIGLDYLFPGKLITNSGSYSGCSERGEDRRHIASIEGTTLQLSRNQG